MSELKLDSSTALVVIDLQKGISLSRELKPHPSERVISNAARLVNAFRARKMPVFLVHVVPSSEISLRPDADETPSMPPGPTPDDWSDFVTEMTPTPSDIVITKRQWGAFYGTDLDLQLRRRKISTIVLCGVSTNYGVESTARFAYEYGYQQVFAEDAMSSRSAEMHELSVKHVLRRIGRIRKTDEIVMGLG